MNDKDEGQYINDNNKSLGTQHPLTHRELMFMFSQQSKQCLLSFEPTC